jgi:hypothetical protein
MEPRPDPLPLRRHAPTPSWSFVVSQIPQETTMPLILLGLCATLLGPSTAIKLAPPVKVDVRIITDEADAVLAILAKKKSGQPVTDADWQQLFSSEPYKRLKKREAQMRRAFDDQSFRDFVLSERLAQRAGALEKTLAQWKTAEIDGAARRALAYLPPNSRLCAKIYPVIKPRENTFVFETDTDPAIFFFIDPETTREKFENTMAHELHHIGYAANCPSKQTSDEIAKLTPEARSTLEWIGAFGEGFAMLAAAGGPDQHPHAVSKSEDRARWDRDMANFSTDLRKVERFFRDLLDRRLNEEEQRKVGFSFFGVQGPWYTVGWKMSVLIEKTYGRERLIECICDQRKLLPTYNEAAKKYNATAKEPLPLWDSSILERIAGT